MSVVRKKRSANVITGLKISIPVKHMVHLPALCVSLPIQFYFDAPLPDVHTLCARIACASSPLPSSWIINSSEPPLILCKLEKFQKFPPKFNISITLSVDNKLQWNVTFLQPKLEPRNCCLLQELPTIIYSVSRLQSILSAINSSKFCMGNPDNDIVQMWKERSLTLHGFNGIKVHSYIVNHNNDRIFTVGKNKSGYLDEISCSSPTIRHLHCQFLLRDAYRCPACVGHRATLLVQLQRSQQTTLQHSSYTAPSSHVNYRYN